MAASIDVKKLRQSLQLSQMQFANRFGFNLRTLKDWEQGRSCPDQAALSLLMVISHSPNAVEEAIRAVS